MLKKIAIVCAGFVFVGQTTFAQSNSNPLDGPATQPQQQAIVAAPSPLMTFVGEIDGVPVVMQVRLTGGKASGTLMVGAEKCPLEGALNGAAIEGTWQSGSGKTYQFRATNDRGVVTLETNGKSLTLRSPAPAKDNTDPIPNQLEQEQVKPLPPVTPGAPEAGSEIGQPTDKVGQYFTVKLPAGWQQMEWPTGTFVTDGKRGFGVVGINLEAGTRFEDFVVKALELVCAKDYKILKQEAVTVPDGQGVEYVLSFTGNDGVKRTGMFRIAMSRTPDGMLGVISHAATPEAQYQAEIGKLLQLANAIRMNPRQVQPTTPQNGPAVDEVVEVPATPAQF